MPYNVSVYEGISNRSTNGWVIGHGFWMIQAGTEPQGLAAVDNNPDLRLLRPANRSKVGAETSSLHVIQSFNAHSGAGPFPGMAFLLFSSLSSFVAFDFLNLSLKIAGKSYQL